MTDRRSALVTGVTGQDGAYLVELLLSRGYAVHGIARRTGMFDGAMQAGSSRNGAILHLHDCDLRDDGRLKELVAAIRPDEIYNLAAQSHVSTSIAEPALTMDINLGGTLHLLRTLAGPGLGGRTRFFQAASSEIFDETNGEALNELSPMRPRNPYAASKYEAYLATRHARRETGVFAVNGILFNHESPRRAPAFVTRKISLAAASFSRDRGTPLRLGNLEARRDWGHARDYVEGMWLSLQRDEPDDYVFATGENHSVREFVERAFAAAGRQVCWQGSGLSETGTDAETGQLLIEVDPAFFRPGDIGATLGDASKARRELKWYPRTAFAELVSEMIVSDMAANG